MPVFTFINKLEAGRNEQRTVGKISAKSEDRRIFIFLNFKKKI